jgi:hypothetical protein
MLNNEGYIYWLKTCICRYLKAFTLTNELNRLLGGFKNEYPDGTCGIYSEPI